MENSIKLPSKCLVYQGITPESITIRTLKGKDEKLIAEMSADNFERKLNALLKNVLTGIDPLKLTIGDRLHLIIWESINSYSKDFSIKHECEHCWQKNEFNVDLSQLEIIELPDGFSEPYEVKLPKCGESVNLRLLRFNDILKVEDMEKIGQNIWLYRYALTIVNDKSIIENVEFLENLSTQDLAHIRAFHERFYHGPKMEYKSVCPKCGGEGVVPIPFRLEMLLPYGEKLRRFVGDAV